MTAKTTTTVRVLGNLYTGRFELWRAYARVISLGTQTRKPSGSLVCLFRRLLRSSSNSVYPAGTAPSDSRIQNGLA